MLHSNIFCNGAQYKLSKTLVEDDSVTTTRCILKQSNRTSECILQPSQSLSPNIDKAVQPNKCWMTEAVHLWGMLTSKQDIDSLYKVGILYKGVVGSPFSVTFDHSTMDTCALNHSQ